MAFTIPIIYGSVRSGRQGIKAALFLQKQLQARGHNAVLVDPKVDQLPFLDKMYKEYEAGEAPETMEKLHALFEQPDGFLIVSGEYNHSVPAALKNLLDHYQSEYQFKPSAIAAYSAGPFGGVRVMMHLRNILGELGTPAISSMFAISKVQDSFDDQGNALDPSYEKRVQKFLDEFAWYLEAFKTQRNKGTPY